MVTAAPDWSAQRAPRTIGVDLSGTSCEVRAALGAAILDAWDDDRDLFRNQTHERTIMFHVGRRLANTVRKWPGRWSVDLEYNRSGSRADPKRLAGEARVPDLIVHHRGCTGAEHNLLAVEAKLVSRGRQQEDVQKLNAMFQDLGYQNAVYVKFYRRRSPDWHWIAEAGQRLHTCNEYERCPIQRV